MGGNPAPVVAKFSFFQMDKQPVLMQINARPKGLTTHILKEVLLREVET